jgi:hypothetical protein
MEPNFIEAILHFKLDDYKDRNKTAISPAYVPKRAILINKYKAKMKRNPWQYPQANSCRLGVFDINRVLPVHRARLIRFAFKEVP